MSISRVKMNFNSTNGTINVKNENEKKEKQTKKPNNRRLLKNTRNYNN